MIDHIIFDLDGTLVDSVVISTEILNEMLEERGSSRAISPQDTRRYVSHGGEQMVAALLEMECGDPAREIVEFRRLYAQRATPLHSLFAGVHEGLVELRGLGYRLGVCSNKPQNLCDKTLSDLGLADLFDVVIGTAPGLRSKPETDLMDLALDRIGTTAERCILVGDSELDHALALAAGMPFLFVTYGYAEAGWDGHGIQRFDQFADVIRSIVDTYPVTFPGTGTFQRKAASW
jgi:phosphoglycolate phosphatase